VIESHVTSLEVARKLKELGVAQKSSLYWVPNEWGEYSVCDIDCEDSNFSIEQSYSAFLVSELSADMPDYSFTLWWESGLWRCSCDGNMLRYRLGLPEGKGYNEELRNYKETNPANALAKLRINLIESNILKAGELK
jgi:hypothetical protein